MGVLRVVDVGSAVEGRGHRRVGVGTGRRRRASRASGDAGEDGVGGGGGHGVRWPEELPDLEWWVGIRVRVSARRRHGRRLGRGRGGGSGADLNWGREEDEVEVRGRAKSRWSGGLEGACLFALHPAV